MASPAPPTSKLVLGYLTSVYARASDTFIRNEVLELRRRGQVVMTYSIREPQTGELVSDEIRREREGTLYILPGHAWGAALAALWLLATRPLRTLAAFALGWRIGARGVRARVWQLAYFLEACFLAARLRVDRVQHLHVHLEEQPASVGMLASALSGVPFSMAVHGPYIFRAPVPWALGEKIARSAFTTCISEFTRSQCMLYAPLAAWPKLHVVRCAPHPSFLDAEPPPLPAERRLVWIGRVCEEKGVPVLIEAAARLAREGMEFELELIGDGPLLPEVRARIAREGLERRVRVLGWAGSDLVRARLGAARVLVQPSLAEGLPVVIMEALALGRPVISTYVAGIPELVEPLVDGWLVPAGSVEALAGAMRAAIQASTAELERLGRAGRARVLEKHQVRTEVDKLLALFEASVARKPPATEAGAPRRRPHRAGSPAVGLQSRPGTHERRRGVPGVRAIEILRREHVWIGLMAECLEKLIADARVEERLPAEAAELLALYESFADGRHQEKEEAVLFRELLARSDEDDRLALAKLLADHEGERRHMASMRLHLLGALHGEPLSVRAFARAAENYIGLHRSHMQREALVLFPMAERLLDRAADERVASGFAALEGGRDDPHGLAEQILGLRRHVGLPIPPAA